MMCGLSDDPGQFREAPMSRMFRQAWNERYRHSEGRNLMTCPF
jgi:hypothetical protein